MRWMNELRLRLRLRRILRAVGIKKLTREQMDVLIHDRPEKIWVWRRRSGKTLTAVLYALLHRKKPVRLRSAALDPAIPDPDGQINRWAKSFTEEEFLRMHALCRKAGIKVCDVIGVSER